MVSAFEADPTEQWFPAALCVVEPGESSLVQLNSTADFNESRFRVMLLVSVRTITLILAEYNRSFEVLFRY